MTTVSVVDAVVNDLRSNLFTGALSHGDPVTELGLAATYEVARPTAKAAIERLVSEGLLERGANRSARVVKMTPENTRDLYYARLLLEREVVLRLSEKRHLPREATQANDEVRAVGAVSSIKSVEPDLRFHRTLVAELGSPHVSSMYAGLLGGVRLCMTQVQAFGLLKAAEIAAEHDAIAERIVAGDGSGAVDELQKHLERACNHLVASISIRDLHEAPASANG